MCGFLSQCPVVQDGVRPHPEIGCCLGPVRVGLVNGKQLGPVPRTTVPQIKRLWRFGGSTSRHD